VIEGSSGSTADVVCWVVAALLLALVNADRSGRRMDTTSLVQGLPTVLTTAATLLVASSL
jgi:hypothetical protein